MTPAIGTEPASATRKDAPHGAEMLALADWRRQVAEIYMTVRATADPKQAWWMWRHRRDRLFRDHPQSPLGAKQKRVFEALDFFDYDPALRFLVDLDPVGTRAPEAQNLREDGPVMLRPFARTRGLHAATGGELCVYWITGYGGGIFLPFADATTGQETYGGGRYLLDGIKGADLGTRGGRLVLDFNFAYNPSCAYNPRWHCPLTPPENRLPRAMRVGELTPLAAWTGAIQD